MQQHLIKRAVNGGPHCLILIVVLLTAVAGCKRVESRSGTWEGYAKEVKVFSEKGESTTALLFEPTAKNPNWGSLILVSDAYHQRAIPPAGFNGKLLQVQGRIIAANTCVTDWQGSKAYFGWLSMSNIGKNRVTLSDSTNYVNIGEIVPLVCDPKKIRILW